MYFPLFVDLSKKKILIVGGGAIASRRVHTLLGFGPRLTVLAPEISPEIRAYGEQGLLTLKEASFFPEALGGMDLVLATTSDEKLNGEIGRLCREQGIPVNVCSRKEDCDFFFPSVIQKGDLVIGINASGKDHRLVKKSRQELEEFFKHE